jgi:arylsulfatase A-like enzyme
MTSQAITRRSFLQRTTALGLCAAGLGANTVGATPKQTNVLFICVDDLRPQLPCYGKDFMVTPNLDRLAAEGVVFHRHYCSVPTCGASRCSMLTGMHPRTAQAMTNSAFEGLSRKDTGQANSLPDLFRRNGYTTVGVGKISHSPNGRRCHQPSGRFDADGNTIYSGLDDQEPELPFAWDRVYGPTDKWGDSWSAFFGYDGGKTRSYTKDKSPACEAADVPDTGYPDGLIAEDAIKELNALKDEPFFLAVGFYKPHLPFCAPKKHWDLYDRDAIPLPEHPDPPANVDLTISLHENGELTGRYASLKDPREATEDEARFLRHGYFACVSYVDAQIGKVLDELDRLGLRDNTIVVVWGDHGWHLGDLHVWGKHTTFDFSLRSTLLMSVPDSNAKGRQVTTPVESVDLYPTLAAYCGLETPAGLDGISLHSALEEDAPVNKQGARGYWRRGKNTASTLCTQEYRIVEWKDEKGKVIQVELYDHKTDPDETVNVAAAHPDKVKTLLKLLHTDRH